MSGMDHERIEAESLIERYDAGRLPIEEETAFEAHLVGCARCQETLEVQRSFAEGVRAMAAEELSRTVARAAPLAILAWLVRRSRGVQGAALGVLALVVGGALAVSFLRAPEAGSGGESAAVPRVVLLQAYRDSGAEASGAAIDAQAAGEPLILAVDVGADAGFTGYRLTVEGPGGEELLRRDGLRPNALEVVMLSLPAGFLDPGEHRLIVDGLRPGGGAERVAEHPFRVAGR